MALGFPADLSHLTMKPDLSRYEQSLLRRATRIRSRAQVQHLKRLEPEWIAMEKNSPHHTR
jgi:hypothetical protein